MDRQTQQHLHLGQDADLSSTGAESAMPGTEVNPDRAELARSLEQAYKLPSQPNEEARTASHSPNV